MSMAAPRRSAGPGRYDGVPVTVPLDQPATMTLYGVAHSPFVARVRLALRLKGLPFEELPPPGGSPRSAEYLALNPIGKIPLLVTAQGIRISESEAIIDYLDEAFPSPSLSPADAAGRIRMRHLIRLSENYAVPAVMRLFAQMQQERRESATVDGELGRMAQALELLQEEIGLSNYAVGSEPSKADCVILPTLMLCKLAGSIFGAGGIVAEFPGLKRYATKARENETIRDVMTRAETALSALKL